MIRCVVFDFDGVLVDSNAVKRRAYTDIFSAWGPVAGEAAGAVLRADTEDDRFGIIRAILRVLPGSPATPEELEPLAAEYAARYNDICEEHAATCDEVAGAASALNRLARDFPLYIVSATPQDPLQRIVARRGWGRHFRGVLGRPATKEENLAAVMAQESIDGAQVVFVGDGRRDLEAALAMGCRFVGVRNQFNDFDSADLTMIDDLHDLPQVIKGIGETRAAGKAG
jgi:phosphoglycolate phosphatase-like HAD superfamily hydrolase